MCLHVHIVCTYSTCVCIFVHMSQALQSGSAEAVIHNLENITPDGFFMLERSLLIAVVETQNLGVLDAVLQVRKRMAAQIKDQEERKHDFDWLCEAASKVCMHVSISKRSSYAVVSRQPALWCTVSIVCVCMYIWYIGRYVAHMHKFCRTYVCTYAYVFHNAPRVQIFAMYFCVALKLACRFH